MTAEIGVTSPSMWIRCLVSMPSLAIWSKMKRLEVSPASPIGPQIEARPPSRAIPIAPLSALPPQISSNAVAFSLEPRPGTPGVWKVRSRTGMPMQRMRGGIFGAFLF